MSVIIGFYIIALFFILTPGILVSLPPRGSKLTVAVTHAVIFALIYKLTHGIVSQALEGFATLNRNNGEACSSSVSCLSHYCDPVNHICNVDPRSVGQPCKDNKDCTSNYCVGQKGNKICTEPLKKDGEICHGNEMCISKYCVIYVNEEHPRCMRVEKGGRCFEGPNCSSGMCIKERCL